jgi:hypothetical protein
MATHARGGGGAFEEVVYDGGGPLYLTKFRRADIGATAADSYKVKVLFRDVDNNLVEHAESITVTF